MSARRTVLEATAPERNETWRSIPGVEGYEASDQGRIRSRGTRLLAGDARSDR